MPPIVSRTACVFVLRRIEDTVEVLLLKRAATLVGAWCQVAGAIEEGETAWQCALREMDEETGLSPESLWSADVCEQFYIAAKDIIEIVPVFVAFVSPQSAIQLNEEHSDFRWLSLTDARNLVSFASQRSVLRHIEEEFILRTPADHLHIDLEHS